MRCRAQSDFLTFRLYESVMVKCTAVQELLACGCLSVGVWVLVRWRVDARQMAWVLVRWQGCSSQSVGVWVPVLSWCGCSSVDMGALRRYQGRFYTILYSFIRLFWLFVQYLGLGQLSPAQEQHKGRCSIVRGASITLHTILLGVGGTIYNNHTLEPFKELGLDFQRVKDLASKLHVQAVSYCQTCPYQTPDAQFPVLLSNCHQEPVSGQACNPLIPIDFFLILLIEEFYGTRYQSGSFIHVESSCSMPAYILLF